MSDTTGADSTGGNSSGTSPTSTDAETTTTSGASSESSGATDAESSTAAADSGSSEAGSSEGSGGMVMVPDPCAEVQIDWADIEPNDTPEQAVDGCTVVDGYWGNFSTPGTIGDGDTVEFVVFRTPVGAADVSFPVSPCWMAAVDLIDVFIYPVDGGLADLDAPVYESATPTTDCEGGVVMLPSDSVYLLELRLATDPFAATEYIW